MLYLLFYLFSAEAQVAPKEIDGWMDSVVMLITASGWCSGVVIDDIGTVATAYHCVATGRKSEVRLRDGREFEGMVVAGDPIHDLALLSVPDLANIIDPLEIRQELPMQGERVYALGHPFAPMADRKFFRGNLRWSVSEGIVSAVGERLIQSDVALNPGNSGGPIVDIDGRIIGIASRKLRGDNLSFLGPCTKLIALMDSQKAMKWWGGQLNIGLSSTMPFAIEGASSWGGYIQAVLRDRGLVTLGIEGPSSAAIIDNGFSKAAEFSTAIRHRIGVGEISMTVDAGGGSTMLWGEDMSVSFHPSVYSRLGFNGIGLRGSVLWTPSVQPLFFFAIELDIPGVVQVF